MKRIYSISTALTFVCATSALAVDKAAVLDTYANIAAAKYQDSLVTAQTLQVAVNTLVTTPFRRGAAKRQRGLVGRADPLPANGSVPFWQPHS